MGTIKDFLKALAVRMNIEGDEPTWFEGFKAIAGEFGFAPSEKFINRTPANTSAILARPPNYCGWRSPFEANAEPLPNHEGARHPEVVSRLEFVIDKLPQSS
jgi:hypothetical protein